jgi:hypothetical protein
MTAGAPRRSDALRQKLTRVGSDLAIVEGNYSAPNDHSRLVFGRVWRPTTVAVGFIRRSSIYPKVVSGWQQAGLFLPKPNFWLVIPVPTVQTATGALLQRYDPKDCEPIFLCRDQELLPRPRVKRKNVMKREGSAPAYAISNALLAARYLALQELRERVRRAEERFASTRLKKTSVLQPAQKLDTRALPKNRNW